MVGTFLPSLISMPLSVGMLISPKYRPRPNESMRRSIVVRTLFSCPEYVLTTYHFFKTYDPLRKDELGEVLEDKVPKRHERREHHHDDQNHRRALLQLVPVRPTDPPQLASNPPGKLDGPGEPSLIFLRLTLSGAALSTHLFLA